MAIRHWPFAPTDFARSRLVLASGRGRRRRSVGWGMALAAFVGGAAVAHLYGTQRNDQLQQQVAAQQELQPLQQQLEQSRLTLRLAEARSQELERQIDALNQRLRESQEELTFFRKTRDGKSEPKVSRRAPHAVFEPEKAPVDRGQQAVEPDR